ncbi:MAG: glycosyltransferase [Candidatus Kapabacteria bacterium]|nr:glycosyltransferase [Candidatus Kapabacteria bacterium]
MNNPIVSVVVITYNQENYIAQTLDSILEQKCNFPFEIIIGEDCSTDRTMDLCLDYQRKYPNIIKVLDNNVNLGLLKNYHRTIMACKGKYIAGCAGDDYWIDDYKLQNQVDFLDANQDYGLVYTSYIEFINNKSKYKKREYSNMPTGDAYEAFLLNSFINGATVCFRAELYHHFIFKFQLQLKNWKMEDRPFWLFISSKTKIHYLNNETAVYRKHDNSITSFKSLEQEIEFIKSSYDVRFYFIENVRAVSDEFKIQLYKKYYKKLLNYYFQSMNQKNSKETFALLKDISSQSIGDYLKYFGSMNYINNYIVKFIIKLILLIGK